MTRRPAVELDVDDDVADAIDKYIEFHRLEPRRVGAFAPSLRIPAKMIKLGKARHVMYRSDKVDPETLRKPRAPLNYIHEHDAGVAAYVPGKGADVSVPDFIRDTSSLVLLGGCLGIGWVDGDGDDQEAEGTRPLPELYCTPCGKALLIIQGKRDLVSLLWGGGLGVEGRGIVG